MGFNVSVISLTGGAFIWEMKGAGRGVQLVLGGCFTKRRVGKCCSTPTATSSAVVTLSKATWKIAISKS